MKKTTIFIIGIILFAVLGCNLPEVPTSGSLKLTIENGINSKTLLPALDIEPASYRITGAGPEGAAFDETTTNSEITIGFLRFGEWTINIEAFNAEGILIAEGTADAAVHVEATTVVPVTIRLLQGTGSFKLGVSWPQDEVENPSITAILKPKTGGDINLDFFDSEGETGTVNVFADTGNTVPVGYYTLVVKVHDRGASGTANHLALGAVEVARILKDQTTFGNYNLQGVPGMGKISLNIEQDFDNPITVSIVPGGGTEVFPTVIEYNSEKTFTAKAEVAADDEDAGNITYVWYLNGESVGIGQNYTINGKYVPGHYRLDVTAFNADGSRAGSAGYEFDVTGNTGRIVPFYLRKILYISNRDGSNDIFSMDENGSNRKKVFISGASEEYPSYSPDGSKIVFASGIIYGNTEVYVINNDGTNLTNISSSPSQDCDPVWSPDGTKIAFRSMRTGYSDIIIANADGTNQVNITKSQNFDAAPCWSPDGLKIIYTSQVNGLSQIFVMNADGSNNVNITNNSDNNFHPRWSPDGSKIVFRKMVDGVHNIYLMNSDGSEQINITNSPFMDMQPSWSPDGTKIIFTSTRDFLYELYTMNIDGSNVTRLTTNEEAELYPSWR